MHKCDVGNLKTYTDFTAKLEIFPGEADKRFAGTHVFFMAGDGVEIILRILT